MVGRLGTSQIIATQMLLAYSTLLSDVLYSQLQTPIPVFGYSELVYCLYMCNGNGNGPYITRHREIYRRIMYCKRTQTDITGACMWVIVIDTAHRLILYKLNSPHLALSELTPMMRTAWSLTPCR